ncbi:MAG TPA: hypothetical protein VFC46_00935 [Humisphaera sp.]|nr:hypothetical protein [Humisphaera sp.]
MTASEFVALPDAEKERIYQELERETPEQRLARSTPLTTRDRERWKKFQDRVKKRKSGRPKFGRHGVKVIALSVERDLLARADAYAKAQGLKRAELFTQAILKLLPKAG